MSFAPAKHFIKSRPFSADHANTYHSSGFQPHHTQQTQRNEEEEDGDEKNVYGNPKYHMKSPTSAELAVSVLKRVSQVTGVENVDRGKSIYDKVGYIKTEPAVYLLSKKSWRTFFDEFKEDVAVLNNNTSGRHSPVSPYQEKVKETILSKEEQNAKAFKQMCRRILTLWREMKIPDSDRDYYSSVLISGQYKDASQLLPLAQYIRVLKHHRDSTIKVLNSIKYRESVLIKCSEIVAWAHRAFGFKITPSQQELAKVASPSDELLEIHEDPDWKTDLKNALAELKRCTIAVVRQIQLWRKELWRPQPFIYEGKNYLIRVSNDMDMLKTESIKRVLESAGINDVDLRCVVFYSTAEVGGLSNSLSLSALNQSTFNQATYRPYPTSPMANVTHDPLNTSSSLVFDDSANVNTLPINSLDAGSFEIIPQATGDLDKSQNDNRIMDAVNIVVSQEAVLQQALLLERRALQARGVFIPALKYEINMK